MPSWMETEDAIDYNDDLQKTKKFTKTNPDSFMMKKIRNIVKKVRSESTMLQSIKMPDIWVRSWRSPEGDEKRVLKTRRE